MLDELLEEVQRNVRAALAEDIGSGDATARLIPPKKTGTAIIRTRQKAILCGTGWAQACFRQVNQDCNMHWLAADGDEIEAGSILCRIQGPLRDLLTAERTAINFLQTLSATSTRTRQYVDAIKGTPAQIYDTRKTLPGLRLAQKYAVRIGGGNNQRIGLYDAILIKENHISATGGIQEALAQAGRFPYPVQIEVETLSQMEEALRHGAQSILLDNFTLQQLHDAVRLNQHQAILEASGGVNLDTVRQIALTGVDRISVGQLTKDIGAIDLSMRLETSQADSASFDISPYSKG